MTDADVALADRIAKLQDTVRLTGNHRYQRYNPITDKWDYLASVSSVLRMLDKPALLGWAAKLGATTGDPMAHVKHRDEAADSGNVLHASIERECHALMGDVVGPPPELSETEAMAFARWCQWAADVQLRPVAVEVIVASAIGFAGRLDFLGWVNGVFTLADWKTGKKAKVYAEHHLQSVALRFAYDEFVGGEKPVGLIVGIPRDGDLMVAKRGTDQVDISMKAFEGLMRAREWKKSIDKEIDSAEEAA